MLIIIHKLREKCHVFPNAALRLREDMLRVP